jgi:anti-sigma factor (TIGR02949 family)
MQTSLPSSPVEELKKEFDQILGEPSDPAMKLDCDHKGDCLKMIQAILDGSSTEQQIERLRNNLHTCQPCIKMYQLEKEIKELLSGKMEKKCCPEQLAASIKARILQFS